MRLEGFFIIRKGVQWDYFGNYILLGTYKREVDSLMGVYIILIVLYGICTITHV